MTKLLKYAISSNECIPDVYISRLNNLLKPVNFVTVRINENTGINAYETRSLREVEVYTPHNHKYLECYRKRFQFKGLLLHQASLSHFMLLPKG